ncbi:6-phosphogluconolactonase [Novosphingobium album (ex Hu et al. 2023)]|uniref:6-phosphogluconolactonase n=1 Tax=Novosphingobium album (ex Hu et al. 2023) TaxID=2930093 RepID=A0ABT0B6N1_9SPHN|nr:6-phosphogluconolactonase [Novosphingobium album (ex Hu et al. 2023)]MCJ2180525.1 6-phosphogluconolactonase [Novosphingobium album (ex Hu et al. 2023)]
MPRIEIIEQAGDGVIAAWLAQRLRAALAQSPEIAISVPGGSTPFPIFDLLANEDLPWERISIWPGDDRIVEEDHPASNVGKIRARLEPVGAQIVPLAEDARPPHFAIAWLGMGDDGHVASLFPNTDPKADDPHPVRRLTPDPLPPGAPFDRLSLTLPALTDSDEIMFVIRGADKRAVFDAAVKGENDLPVARLLRAARHKVTCFC